MDRYDRDAAVRYAATWALRRNPLYLNFDALGGDCTNFASQCLYAGTGEMNFTPVYGWYYQNGYKRTASWTGVQYLYRFLVQNTGPGPRARIVTAAEMAPGDLVQLGRATGVFYHSPIVVSVSGGQIFIAAHSEDCWMRNLSDYTYDQARFLKIFMGERP